MISGVGGSSLVGISSLEVPTAAVPEVGTGADLRTTGEDSHLVGDILEEDSRPEEDNLEGDIHLGEDSPKEGSHLVGDSLEEDIHLEEGSHLVRDTTTAVSRQAIVVEHTATEGIAAKEHIVNIAEITDIANKPIDLQ